MVSNMSSSHFPYLIIRGRSVISMRPLLFITKHGYVLVSHRPSVSFIASRQASWSPIQS